MARILGSDGTVLRKSCHEQLGMKIINRLKNHMVTLEAEEMQRPALRYLQVAVLTQIWREMRAVRRWLAEVMSRPVLHHQGIEEKLRRWKLRQLELKQPAGGSTAEGEVAESLWQVGDVVQRSVERRARVSDPPGKGGLGTFHWTGGVPASRRGLCVRGIRGSGEREGFCMGDVRA